MFDDDALKQRYENKFGFLVSFYFSFLFWIWNDFPIKILKSLIDYILLLKFMSVNQFNQKKYFRYFRLKVYKYIYIMDSLS